MFGRQPVQSTALAGPHEDPGEADSRPPLRRQCCSRRPYRMSSTTYHIQLNKYCSPLQPRGKPKEGGNPPPACAPGRVPPPHIPVSETELRSVNQFSYLGCTISSVRIDKDLDNRLAKAKGFFGRLYRRVWNNNNLKKPITVYTGP